MIVTVDDKGVQQMREDLQAMDDGSIEYEEVYSIFSWFAQRFSAWNENKTSSTMMTRL
jgi:hypothetical protein